MILKERLGEVFKTTRSLPHETRLPSEQAGLLVNHKLAMWVLFITLAISEMFANTGKVISPLGELPAWNDFHVHDVVLSNRLRLPMERGLVARNASISFIIHGGATMMHAPCLENAVWKVVVKAYCALAGQSVPCDIRLEDSISWNVDMRISRDVLRTRQP